MVSNTLQASHSATDLRCLNPAALHSCQTTTGGGEAAAERDRETETVCCSFKLNASISNSEACVSEVREVINSRCIFALTGNTSSVTNAK